VTGVQTCALPISEDRCADQLVITMPFYVSVAYSLGAFVARRIPGGHLLADSLVEVDSQRGDALPPNGVN
jgi:hypothetical protein